MFVSIAVARRQRPRKRWTQPHLQSGATLFFRTGLIGLSAAQVALLLSLLGYEEDGTSASEGTASTMGGDASAVNPQNVA